MHCTEFSKIHLRLRRNRQKSEESRAVAIWPGKVLLAPVWSFSPPAPICPVILGEILLLVPELVRFKHHVRHQSLSPSAQDNKETEPWRGWLVQYEAN